MSGLLYKSRFGIGSVLLLLYLALRVTAAQAISVVELTTQQQQYLSAHPSIKVSASPFHAPYSFFENAQATGYQNDLIRLAASKVGLQAEFVVTRRLSESLAKLKTKQLDVIASIAIHDDINLIYTRYHPLQMADALVTRSGDIFARDFHDISSVAVITDSVYQGLLTSRYPSIKIRAFDNMEEAFDELIFGDVDAILDAYDILNFYIHNAQLKEVKLNALLDNQLVKSAPQFMGLDKDNLILRELLDKGLLAISEKELSALQDKWMLFDSQNKQSEASMFSHRELQYLQQHGALRMCVDPDWLPIEAIENGKYVGIGAEIVALFAQRLDNPIVLVETKDWNETLHFIQSKRCDFIPLISRTEKREQFLAFSSPYLSFPMVLATHQDNPAYQLNEASHKPLGVCEGSSYKELFDDLYPNGDLRLFNSIEDGFEAVKRGDIYGYIDILPVMAKQVQSHYPEMKLVDNLNHDYQLALAVAKDEPILLDIFNKIISSIDVKKREQILNRWLPIVYDNDLGLGQYRFAILSLIALLLVAIVLVFSLCRSRTSCKQLREKLHKLESISLCDYLTGLPNQDYFKEHLSSEWARATRSKQKLSLLLIDIDNFKYFNQEYGLKAGDECLIELAQRLKKLVKRPADLLARYQGEEFVILMPETDEQGIRAITAEIYYMMSGWRLKNAKSPSGDILTISIGASCMVPSADCPEVELYRRAERALYRAQDKGYNQMQLY